MKEVLKYKIGSRVRYISQEFLEDRCEHCGSEVESMIATEEEGVIERVDVTYYANMEPIICYHMTDEYKVIREDKILEVIE